MIDPVRRHRLVFDWDGADFCDGGSRCVGSHVVKPGKSRIAAATVNDLI